MALSVGSKFASYQDLKRAVKLFEFAIKLRSLDGDFLTVTHHGPNHNHECAEQEFRHYPSQRRLDTEQTNKVREMVKLDANKKLIQAQVEEDTNKVVLLKDIHNISRATSSTQHNSELDELSQFVSENLPSVSMDLARSGDEVMGIFFQDKQMMEVFAKFPEVLLVDATYKVNRRDMPLYSIVVIDGNMETHPVCFFLVSKEDEATLRKMIQIFKEKNSKWTETTIVISDKDFTERLVFKSEIPQINMEICLFHVLRTFGREMTTEKANITSEQKLKLLDLLQQITYAKTEAEYTEMQSKLNEFGRPVETYFNQNCFSTRTNNRIESLFQKIKSVVTSRMDLKALIERIFRLLQTLRQRRSHSMIMDSMKVRVQLLDSQDARAYQRVLTPESYKLVETELKEMEGVRIVSDSVVECNNSYFTPDGSCCTCRFSTAFRLPCRHVMAIHKHASGSAFIENAIHHRWTRRHFSMKLPMMEGEGGISVSELAAPEAPRTLNHNEKYKKAHLALNSIATIMAQMDMQTSNLKMEQVNDLLTLLKNEQHFIICEIVAPPDSVTSLDHEATTAPPPPRLCHKP